MLCLIVLAAITAANFWGVAESARLFILPTLIFIAAIALVIVSGLLRSHPVVAPPRHLPSVAEAVGVLLLLQAFASGCSALTGVEAIANAVPSFRKPRVKHAQHTEAWLGALLGAMLIGLAILIRKYHVTPDPHETVLAQLAAIGVGKGIVFYGIQLITTILLALAANTSFGGLPVLASLLARDNFLPHLFFLKADRQVHRYGVGVLAAFAAVLLVVVGRQYPAAGAVVRDRGIRRVHAVPDRHGAALARAARVRLGGPRDHQRRRRGAHPGRARGGTGQQVHRGRLDRGARGAALRADVLPHPRDVREDRRPAADRRPYRRRPSGKARWSWCRLAACRG